MCIDRFSAWLLLSSVAAVACGGSDDGPGGAGDDGLPGAASPADPADPASSESGSAGSMTPGGSGGPAEDPAAPEDPSAPPPAPGFDCGLSTAFDGDDFCILPPPEAEGFQIHVGPDDYDDPDQVAEFLILPGDETDDYYYLKAGNAEDVYFYRRQYRMRPGSHHLIVYEESNSRPDGWGTGIGFGSIGGSRRLGGSQNAVKDNPMGETPPENAGLGIPLRAEAQLNVNLHHVNPTDEPLLREAWVNFWYVDAEDVTEEAREMFALGGLGMAIRPGQHVTLNYDCPITEPGRVLTMYGHRHAHNVRFSAWRVRGGDRQLVYEGYDWGEPLVLEYNSITENPTPDRATGREGGWSGILDVVPGDALEWECEIQNTSEYTLRHTNETYRGEMCILIGDTVGPSVACPHF